MGLRRRDYEEQIRELTSQLRAEPVAASVAALVELGLSSILRDLIPIRR